MTSKWSLVWKSAPRLHSKKGKLTTTENIQIDLDTTIQQLEQEGT